jgi:hypothetical protein
MGSFTTSSAITENYGPYNPQHTHDVTETGWKPLSTSTAVGSEGFHVHYVEDDGTNLTTVSQDHWHELHDPNP